MKKTLLSIVGVLIWMMTAPHAVLAQDVGSKFGITSSVMDKQAITEQLRQRQPEVITPTWYTEQVLKKKGVSASEKPKTAKVAVNSVRQMMPMLRPEQVRHLAQRMQAKGLLTPPQNTAPIRIQSSDGDSVELWVWSMMSMSWYMSGDNQNPGLISIQLDDNEISVSDIYRREQYIMGSGGMLPIDDTYYAFEKGHFIGDITTPAYDYYKLYEYDTATWTGDQPTEQILASAIYPAYDSKSGLVYVLYVVGDANGEAFSFGYFDLESQRLYKICDTNIIKNRNNAAGCTFLLTTDGKFYFAERDESLYAFNPKTGEATLIGKTLSESLNSRAWAIDHRTDKIYLMTYDEAMQSGIYEINPETAEATELGRIPMGHWVMSMGVPCQYHAADSPAKPENLSAHFENGQKEGTISFTLPQTTRKGETLDGTLRYIIMVNGVENSTGEAIAGEAVTANTTLSRDGFNAITVKANEGVEAHVYVYAGDDIPKAVENVAIGNEGHQIELSWAPSTEGMNGGYVNPDDVKYIVTRYPDSLVIGTVSGTTFTDIVTPEKPTVYHYGVKAVFNGKEGDETKSEKIAISDGFELPYHEDFLADDISYFYYTPLRGETSNFGWHITTYIDENEEKRGAAFADFSWPDICDTDHWLYTPEFIMQPGVYSITLLICPRDTEGWDPNQLSIYFGKGLSSGELAEVLAPTDIELGFQRISANVRVEEAGNYRFALRCTSETENSSGLWLEEYDIDGGARPEAPEAPQLALAAAPLGAQAVNVTVTAPTKTIGGSELNSIDKIEIHRYDSMYVGGVRDILVKTFEQPAPGEILTFTDTPFLDGCFETYWTMAYNEAGRGVMTDGRLYVGQDVPLAPKNPDVWADEVPHVTWEAPEGTLYGGYADLDNLTYNIYSEDPLWGELFMVADGVSGTSYDDPSADMEGGNTEFGDQYPLSYAIAAVNGKYFSNVSFSYTWPVLVGTPYKLPILESFLNFNTYKPNWKHQWVWRVREGGWNLGYGDKMTRDGDDLRCWVMGGYGNMELTSGRITLNGAERPRLLYSYYQLPGQSNRLEAKIVLHDGTEKIVGTHDFATMQGGMKWMTQEVDLSEYASEDWVMLRFSCYGDNLQEYVLLDDIRVFDLVEKNLSMKGMTVPELIRLGKPKHIQAYITNTGSQTATGYHVNLYVNDKLEASVAGPSIESLANATIELPYDPRADAIRYSDARVEIAWDDDQIAEDNVSDTKSFQVLNNALAIVTDLAAEENEDGTIGLGWSEPVNEHDYTFTEDFESAYYEPGSTEYLGDWKLVDRDGGYTKMINGFNWSTAGDPASFIVYLPNVWSGVTGLSNDPVWGTYSGSRCAISIGTIPEGGIQGNDDWMISTELTGEAQTISLWAKSLDDHFGNAESFEVLYSTTGREVEDFTTAATYRDISAVWTKYEVAIPAGAKYLAIRNIGKNRNMLSIDDITMKVAGYTPQQYVIWRNGEPTDTINAEQTVYTDRVKENGDYTYQIQVLYEEGPSRLSNAALVTATNGITEMSRGALRVGSQPGYIEVYEAEGERVEIFTPDGRRVYTGTGRRYLSVAVQRGTYIVRIGCKATKIIVR